MKRNGSNKALVIVSIIICIAIVGVTAFAAINKDDARMTQNNITTSTSKKDSTDKDTSNFDKNNVSSKTTAGQTTDSITLPTTVEQITQHLEETTTKAKPVTTTEKVNTTKETATKAEKKPSSGRIVVNPNHDPWNLIVVNSGREIPSGYKPKLKEILGCGKYLDYRVAPHYEDMYYAAKKDGITLTPYSAYRSYERQERNYNNLTNQYMSQYKLSRADAAKKAATVILPPGTSEHNLGLAMDICNTYDSFANTKEYAWLQKHAHEYGFILRYTKAKQPITGIVPEPWHWRYVGVEYAKKIKDSGLCLEEYLDSVGIAY